MKYLIISTIFLLNFVYSYSQSNTLQYVVSNKTVDFDLALVNQLDFSLLDTYRAENVDNTIVINHNNEQITIVLYSAARCRENNLLFDEELVKKGQLMGTNPNVSKTFQFEIVNGTKLNDLTTY